MGNGIMAETSTKQVIAPRQPFPIKRRHLLLLSLLLFVASCMLNLFLCSAFADLFGASFQRPGLSLEGGAPIRLGEIDCPLFLSKREAGSFSAIVSNPTNSEHRASVRFSTWESVQSLSASQQELLLPPGSTTRVVWSASFGEPGSRFVGIELTNDDPASRSYEREAFNYCGVAVVNILGLRADVIVVLGVGILVFAVAIAIYTVRRL